MDSQAACLAACAAALQHARPSGNTLSGSGRVITLHALESSAHVFDSDLDTPVTEADFGNWPPKQTLHSDVFMSSGNKTSELVRLLCRPNTLFANLTPFADADGKNYRKPGGPIARLCLLAFMIW